MRFNFLIVLLLSAVVLSGCTGVPKGIQSISNFELDQYLGKWYEIARLDHSFERGLSNVSAEYSLRENGLVNVTNRGYSVADEQWSEAIGRAKFKSDPNTGHLLVSFFGPFFGSYVIFELDDYQQAFISGNSRKFLWFLSRTPTVTEQSKAAFLKKTAELGFNTEEIIWVEQGVR